MFLQEPEKYSVSDINIINIWLEYLHILSTTFTMFIGHLYYMVHYFTVIYPMIIP